MPMTDAKTASVIPLKLYRDQLVTRGDLEEFKKDLLLSLAMLIKENSTKPPKKWLKSHEIKKLLGISNGTLQAMRFNGTIPFTKIGNLIYYDQDDINAVMSKKKIHPMRGDLPPRR
jgi:hypothetical protein